MPEDVYTVRDATPVRGSACGSTGQAHASSPSKIEHSTACWGSQTFRRKCSATSELCVCPGIRGLCARASLLQKKLAPGGSCWVSGPVVAAAAFLPCHCVAQMVLWSWMLQVCLIYRLCERSCELVVFALDGACLHTSSGLHAVRRDQSEMTTPYIAIEAFNPCGRVA